LTHHRKIIIQVNQQKNDRVHITENIVENKTEIKFIDMMPFPNALLQAPQPPETKEPAIEDILKLVPTFNTEDNSPKKPVSRDKKSPLRRIVKSKANTFTLEENNNPITENNEKPVNQFEFTAPPSFTESNEEVNNWSKGWEIQTALHNNKN